MLALTPAPLQTAGEHALFAELTRWDRGGTVRGAVVASIPVVDGPVERRVSDAVLFVPEGLAVVRIVEVVRQSGVVTATPEGSWTIGPGAGPGEVLQLAGGGSTPLDGLMRAGMDAAVRLRRAGLEPGRIARLTVLVGDLTGLVPADGDLGEGDQVALLEPRSLLLGIARSARYAGVDNPRLWTTADVRAALTALGLPGRGPSVEELNGEGFPYSPYVLRKRELLAPAAMAASPAMGGGSAPAAVPLVDPVAAAAVAAAAIRADEEAAARAAAGLAAAEAAIPVPAPAPAAAGPAPAPHPRTARFTAPAAQSGAPVALVPAPAPAPAAAPVAVAAAPAPAPVAVPAAPPAEAPADETGGLGGLFGDLGADAPPVPEPAPAAAAPVPPGPPIPLVGPRRRSPAARRRLALLAAGAAAAVVAVVAGVVGLTGGDDDAAAAGTSPAVASSAPTAAEPAPPQPGDRSVVGGRGYVLQQVRTEHTCTGNAYGDVADFFESGDCAGLSRSLWSTDVGGRAVVVSVAAVDMGDPAGARALRALTDRDGSGNVSDLLREGVSYPGGPAELSGAEYASTTEGSVVTIVETAWVAPGGTGGAADLDVVAGEGLSLPVPTP
ncbi:hypothetical protein SAMN05660690_3189 [Geodermatophilus telluris]|uniref:Uncharacterized protein n=1 Tax=Geodermatophilus telluris TaxID=1190417 RepID=A0A1G6R1M2_9ACTN|nr:hypothetical protein [Geodermatophilus telluris]SDC98313.1 hypothetical protein SAMN05660690_3189 [Geodermatophilus telluris]